MSKNNLVQVEILDWNEKNGDKPDINLFEGRYFINGEVSTLDKISEGFGLKLDLQHGVFKPTNIPEGLKPDRRSFLKTTGLSALHFFMNPANVGGHVKKTIGKAYPFFFPDAIEVTGTVLSNSSILSTMTSRIPTGVLNKLNIGLANSGAVRNLNISILSNTSVLGELDSPASDGVSGLDISQRAIVSFLKDQDSRKFPGYDSDLCRCFENHFTGHKLRITYNQAAARIQRTARLFLRENRNGTSIEFEKATDREFQILQEGLERNIRENATNTKGELSESFGEFEISQDAKYKFTISKPLTEHDYGCLRSAVWEVAYELASKASSVNKYQRGGARVIELGNTVPDASLSVNPNFSHVDRVEIQCRDNESQSFLSSLCK